MKKNDYLQTPHWVYNQLGSFDLDPCAGENTNIADTNWAIERGENGLLNDWFGLVFCNPPFSHKEEWAKKMIEHGEGILLLPERGSAPWFGLIAQRCTSYFVMGKKINFIGGTSSNNVGSVLFCFGYKAKNSVAMSELPGHMVTVEFFNKRE